MVKHTHKSKRRHHFDLKGYNGTTIIIFVLNTYHNINTYAIREKESPTNNLTLLQSIIAWQNQHQGE